MADKSPKSQVLAFLRQQSKPLPISAIKEQLQLQIPQRTIRRWLSAWAVEGVLERQGANKGTTYRYCHTELGFLSGLDGDLQQSLLKQIRDLWTHSSTAIEGNTLTLGDTHFVLEQGLTISGRPLQHHQQVLGHASAIDLIYALINKPLETEDLFQLHLAVQTERVHDIYKPNGAWKLESNGTYAMQGEQRVFIEYAHPKHVPALMNELLAFINQCSASLNIASAAAVYAKVHMGLAHIHPFWDGNGRMARLIANIPLLKAGLPPLMINYTQRRAYIDLLASYQIRVGQLSSDSGAWPDNTQLRLFTAFCRDAYGETVAMIDEVKALQEKRAAI